ncbi:type II toxin-antitoxin system death-on-curing family toxin [Mycobacteroides abscessus]|uniref:type II toxin-antitoxin system death-on-curing family toxin n=1 Tax=Mycobacteroides abscessus TaxID=36809 RepID=UPI000C2658C8
MYIRVTLDQIRMFHDMLLEQYGGLPGEKEPGLIESMVEKPFSGFGNYEFYPGLFMKAAVYLEGFATKQLFNDGNKRTALLCALTFLDLNGYEVDVEWDTLFDLTIAVAKKELSLEELAVWLEENSIPYT